MLLGKNWTIILVQPLIGRELGIPEHSLIPPLREIFGGAFYELDSLRVKLGLSDPISENTAYIYRKIEGRHLVKGRTIHGMMAAAIYVACRETGTPSTIKDITQNIYIKRKNIARNIRIITVELGINAPMLDPMKCISKVANAAQLNERIKRHALCMMNELIKRKIPTGEKTK